MQTEILKIHPQKISIVGWSRDCRKIVIGWPSVCGPIPNRPKRLVLISDWSACKMLPSVEMPELFGLCTGCAGLTSPTAGATAGLTSLTAGASAGSAGATCLTLACAGVRLPSPHPLPAHHHHHGDLLSHHHHGDALLLLPHHLPTPPPPRPQSPRQHTQGCTHTNTHLTNQHTKPSFKLLVRRRIHFVNPQKKTTLQLQFQYYPTVYNWNTTFSW